MLLDFFQIIVDNLSFPVDRQVLYVTIAAIAAWSTVQAYGDLRTSSNNQKLKPDSLAVAAGFRFAIVSVLYVLFSKSVRLEQSIVMNVTLLLLSNALFSGNIFSIVGRLSLASLYYIIIAATDRKELIPFWRFKKKILLRHNSPYAIAQVVDQILAEFTNVGIREAYANKITSRIRSGEEQEAAHAEFLITRVRWEKLGEFDLVPRLYKSVRQVAEISIAVEMGLEVSAKLDLQDLNELLESLLIRTGSASTPHVEIDNFRGDYVDYRESFIWKIVEIVGPNKIVPTLERFAARSNIMPSTVDGGLANDIPAQPLDLPWQPALQVIAVELHNIRCFDSLELNFSREAHGTPWTILLGDNGLGKSTVLRSIAIGLCDGASAASLIKRLPGNFLADGSNYGSIHVQVQLANDPASQGWIKTLITRDRDGGIEVKQQVDHVARERLFVCGYGAMRSGFGTQDFSGYATQDALLTLFEPSASLQNPELAIRRMQAAGQDIGKIQRRLESVLMLDEGSISITPSGITVRGPWGTFVPAGAIGDGYQATLAWIADFLGWCFLFSPAYLSNDVSGIVLIDEIEKHLHPRWQRQLIALLSRQFPQVQFIATTHSPLCAGGLSDLKEGAGHMFHFKISNSGNVEVDNIDPLVGWRYDQLITSEIFGLRSARDVETEKLIDRLRAAYEANDDKQVKELGDALEERSISVAQDERDRAVRERMINVLENLNRKSVGALRPEERQ